jgi:ATP-dependent Lon protease
MTIELDALDKIASAAFEGVVVRKDLVRRFKGQYPVPTYVAEFVLGRYCSSVNEQEIQEGLRIVYTMVHKAPQSAQKPQVVPKKAH